MVRRNLYQREDVVAAAVSVVRAEGFAQLSARRVADRLGASTAPVYSNFANMDELAQAVKLAIADLVVAETEVCRSGEPFLDMGIGVLAFARSHPELYAAVFMPGADEAEAGHHLLQVLLGRMSAVESLAALDPSERLILLRKMAIFTQGLALHVMAGHTDEESWDEVLMLLSEAGRAMVTDAFNRPPRSEAEIALLAKLCECRVVRPNDRPGPELPKEASDA